ncbi:polysaccharide pyruvyl transferase family protein [Niallia circulans]|uniref:Uncharacterized protein n=1 Tax=Niallia circulans TaxID=1397 RepID=A0A268F8I6_NIACI|nr:polysaccharide pyruvyl transferase family protein [Niallia circulans]AYV68240.1 polysaccharide pyruvyl transferase family protein [Niallia circulans]PAD81696.1 hypothetical protein CHH57_18795 [Niallia circulans]
MSRIKRFLMRNELSIGYKKSQKNKVNLEWWNKKPNLGDGLAIVIYDWMLDYYGLDKEQKVNGTKHLLTVGSLIGMGGFDATVWGSGIHSVSSMEAVVKQKKNRKYDIRAVRGPITRWFLQGIGYECPEVYGDPGILLPLIYKPENVEKKYPISVIYHMSQNGKDGNRRDDLNYINIETYDHKSFLNDVVASELVISSTLHGIILAEAYGVPAIFLKKGMDQEIIKFYDWYFSTGRTSVKMAETLDEALKMQAMELPNLSEMQEQLIAVFPKDIWN